MADRSLFDEGSILRQSASLRLMVRALVRDDAEADDVVQETWLTAMRSPGPGFEPAAWLRGIARNVLRTVRRTDRRRTQREVESFTPGSAPSAADDVAKVERLRELLDLVSALREPARQAVILRYFDGLMSREIAERLGIPVATVKARIQTGLRSLREALDQRHGGDRSAWHAAFAGLVPEMLSAGAAATAVPALVTGGIAMKTAAGVLGAIVLVALIVWNGSRNVDGGARHEVFQAPGTAEPGEEIPFGQPGNPAAVARIAPRALAAGSDDSPSSAPASGELRVMVVRKDGGAAVAGARVRMWDTSEVPINATRQDHLLSWDAVHGPPTASEPVECITDAQGAATFPGRPRTARFFADMPGKWGQFYYLAERGGEPRIEIEEDLEVAIRVVNPGGAPVGGVPVRLSRFASDVRPIDFAYGLTRSDGVYLARHLQMWRQFFGGAGFQSMKARLGASFDDGPGGAVFDPAVLPKEPLTLTLPPTGRIKVKVVDAEGRPFIAPAYVGIKVREGLPPRPVIEEHPEDWVYRTLWRPSEAGVAWFPWVGLGATFTVKVHVLERDRELASIESAGPTRAGEETDITVEVGRRLPVVRARLVDESGRPLKAHYAYVGAEGSAAVVRSAEWIRAITDENGAIRAPIRDVPWKLRRGGLDFKAYDRADYFDSPACWLGARTLDAEAASRTDVDLGDVVMRRVPPLVAGVVRDDQGEPIGDAMVIVEVRALGDQRGFWDLRGIQSKTRADGSFAISEPCMQGDLRLRVDAPGLRSEAPLEFTRGVTGLAVVVPRRASVAGSVILPDGVRPRDLCVSMSGECVPPLAKDGWGDRPGGVNPDGSFSIEGLRPGTGTLVIAPRSSRAESNRVFLAVIGGIQVAGVTRDPRLQGIDLRDRVRARALTVVDPDGNALGGAEIKFRLAGVPPVDGAVTCETGVDGRATLVTGPEPVSVTVSKEGYLDRELVVADPETKVVVDVAVTLDIAVKSEAALPMAPENLLISLAREGEPEAVGSEGGIYVNWDRPHGMVDAAGVATIKAPFTGRARLTVVVNRDGESHEGGTLSIEIKPSPARQRIEWRIPAEAIRRR